MWTTIECLPLNLPVRGQELQDGCPFILGLMGLMSASTCLVLKHLIGMSGHAGRGARITVTTRGTRAFFKCLLSMLHQYPIEWKSQDSLIRLDSPKPPRCALLFSSLLHSSLLSFQTLSGLKLHCHPHPLYLHCISATRSYLRVCLIRHENSWNIPHCCKCSK